MTQSSTSAPRDIEANPSPAWKAAAHGFPLVLFGVAWFVTRNGTGNLAWFFVLYFVSAILYAVVVPRGLGPRFVSGILMHAVFFQGAVIGALILNPRLEGADQILYAALPAAALVLAGLGGFICWLSYSSLGKPKEEDP